MNNEDIKKQLEEQQKALVKIYRSVEKTRKYILWSSLSSLLLFVLPLILAIIMIPKIIGTFNTVLGDTVEGGDITETLQGENLTKSLNTLRELGISL